MEIIIREISVREKADMNVEKWPIWTKEVSEFDWFYEATEECLLLSGRVLVTTQRGGSYEIKAGNFVIFPAGLSCHWKVLEPVKLSLIHI